MSLERRRIRPYTVDPALASTLSRVTLWLDDLCCEADSSLLVDDGSLSNREVNVKWAAEGEFDEFRRQLIDAAWATGVHPQWLHLILVARTSSLKLAEKLLDCQLDGLDALQHTARLDLGPDGARRTIFCADNHGVIVDAYVALSPDWRAASPTERRLPKRPSSWLARATFSLDARAASVLFHPRPLDDAKRGMLGLPDGTLRYIDLRGVNVKEVVDGIPDVDVWVDEGVLSQLNAYSGSATALYFQRQLVLDFVAAVAYEYARDEAASSGDTGSFDDVKDSLIGKVIELATEMNDDARDSMLSLCRDNPALFVAKAEAVLGLREGVQGSLRAAS